MWICIYMKKYRKRKKTHSHIHCLFPFFAGLASETRKPFACFLLRLEINRDETQRRHLILFCAATATTVNATLFAIWLCGICALSASVFASLQNGGAPPLRRSFINLDNDGLHDMSFAVYLLFLSLTIVEFSRYYDILYAIYSSPLTFAT